MNVASTVCVVVSASRMRCARGVAWAAAALWAVTITFREKVLTASIPEARIVRIGMTASGVKRWRSTSGIRVSNSTAATEATTARQAIRVTRTQSILLIRRTTSKVLEIVLGFAILVLSTAIMRHAGLTVHHLQGVRA